MQFTNQYCKTGCPGVHLEDPLIVALDLHFHLNFSFDLLAFYNKNLLQLREEVHICDWVFEVSQFLSWLSLLASLRRMVPLAAFLASLSTCWTVTSSVSTLTILLLSTLSDDFLFSSLSFTFVALHSQLNLLLLLSRISVCCIWALSYWCSRYWWFSHFSPCLPCVKGWASYLVAISFELIPLGSLLLIL